MNIALKAVGIVLLLSSSWAALRGAALLDQISRDSTAVGDLARQTSAVLAAQNAEAIQTQRTLREELPRQLEETRQVLLALVETRSAELIERADHRLATLETSISSVVRESRETLVGLQVATRELAELADQANDLFDCEALRQSCLPNRILSTSSSVERAMDSTERTMDAIADAAPAITTAAVRNGENLGVVTQNIALITSDVRVVTERFSRPRTFRGKLWEGLKLGALVAGRIGP